MPTADCLLTDVEGKPGRFWARHTTFVGPMRPPSWLRRLVGEAWAWNLIGVVAALRLFLRRRHCRAVVTMGGASGLLFAWLQALVPWGRRPHVLVDCNWYLAGGPLRRWFQRLRLRLAARSVYRFVVWASHEVEDYAAAFGLPRDMLTYVPFHTTLDGYAWEERDDGYLFAGGNTDRDYRTLVEAVRPLGLPTWLATTRGPELLAGVDVPPHVRVEGTTPDGFRQAMAAAKLVVVPMEADLLFSGGQQTCLNAMLLGKPTIAVGHKWARDLIDDGEDGLIVDYGDVAGLRRAIAWVLEDPARAAELAARGRAKAAWFTTERTMRTVYELACGRPAPGTSEGPAAGRALPAPEEALR
jgi:glycosyltransferase involved in cell wall biosynthesis